MTNNTTCAIIRLNSDISYIEIQRHPRKSYTTEIITRQKRDGSVFEIKDGQTIELKVIGREEPIPVTIMDGEACITKYMIRLADKCRITIEQLKEGDYSKVAI